MKVLTLNVGSSSLKFGIYTANSCGAQAVADGEIDVRGERYRVHYHEASGATVDQTLQGDSDDAALQALEHLAGALPFDAVAHRIVHGGPWLREHCVIDDEVIARIQDAASFAPLHVPAALRWIRHVSRALPSARQVACLDTAFHWDLPETSRTLPLPHALREKGVQRYGFHGLSCESILDQLKLVPERLVIAHLGSGASLTAVYAGRSLDTSMGMTPTGGIIMGTRPGDLDPGVMLFLLRAGHCTADQLEYLFEHRSGLLGISGLSADVRSLRAAGPHPGAALALEQFALSVARQAAAMAVVLGGIDLLVFTGGIGEHDEVTRERVSRLLTPCFPTLETQVLPAQENRMMARHAARLLTD